MKGTSNDKSYKTRPSAENKIEKIHNGNNNNNNEQQGFCTAQFKLNGSARCAISEVH